ncbi:MAG: sulfotransferase [Planctomycetes bacterium]|nr:sulfotransferase [Planctomycetota bacterium]
MAPQTTRNTQSPERTWAPRMWIGSDFFGWLRIMTRGHFRFNLPHVHIGVCTSVLSFGHSVLKCAQNALYRRQIERTKIEKAPIFIVGHWRTGTTLLHEFLILDQQHNYPNTYQCLVPNHFLLTESHFKKWFWFLLPERRPMDNMTFGWDRPQEDEFAMCLLGQPSPYLDIIFPNRPPMTPGALDLEGLTPGERRNWKRVFHRFIQTLTMRDPRRLVLKSPPHTCRIKTLLELYPDARFVHIVRNPYHVFPSTVKLWKKLAETQGVQTPRHRDIEERVLQTLPHLYAKLEEGRKLVDPSRFHELRYEDLIQDPLGEMRKLYDHLDLGGFEELQPRLESYLAQHANYETNKFQMTTQQRQEVTERWGDVIRRYGYPVDSNETMQSEAATVRPISEQDGSEPTLLPFPNSQADSEVAAVAAHFRAA